MNALLTGLVFLILMAVTIYLFVLVVRLVRAVEKIAEQTSQ